MLFQCLTVTAKKHSNVPAKRPGNISEEVGMVRFPKGTSIDNWPYYGGYPSPICSTTTAAKRSARGELLGDWNNMCVGS